MSAFWSWKTTTLREEWNAERNRTEQKDAELIDHLAQNSSPSDFKALIIF